VDILARVTAALNTDLEGATAELDMTHRELQNAQARIAQLEAQLARQQQSEEAKASCPSRSPPRKRLRYGTPAATSRLQ
jgi:multidrug resistance efflux pump